MKNAVKITTVIRFLMSVLFAQQICAMQNQQPQDLETMALEQCKIVEQEIGLKWDGCVDCMKGLLRGLMEDQDEGADRAGFEECMQKSLTQQYKSDPEKLEKVKARFTPKF